MPYFEISRIGGRLQSRWSRTNFLICEHLIGGCVHVFFFPTGSISEEKKINLKPEDALQIYIAHTGMGITSVIGLSCLPAGKRIADYIDKLIAFEDTRLGIIYLNNERYVRPIMRLIEEGLDIIHLDLDPLK